MKGDLFIYEKRPKILKRARRDAACAGTGATNLSKETCIHVKRDLFIYEKRQNILKRARRDAACSGTGATHMSLLTCIF